ncbi:MAG: carbohydrate-binding protein [Porticoccaceae bacterium]
METDNEDLDIPEGIEDTSNKDSNTYIPFGEIPDLSLDDITVRGRPYIDDSLGYNVIRSDMGTLLRGVSLSTDGGDPYNALNLLDKSDIKLESLQSMVSDYGFNTLHVYLEGDAEQNPDPVGINEELADHLVNITREAKMYLIITIGNNGENGAIHSMEKVLAFWDLYGAKYKDETHVIYEAHNEPVGGINAYWTPDDWDKQARMYEKIREVAPDTMILLGSFMSFFGGTPAINGANDLANEFPGIWDNAGFAFHAYWDLGQVESTIEAFKESDDYPALLCTEFWPGETKNGANEVFESHNIGWTQFEWLGGNDLELNRVKNYLDTYGTAWRPDNSDSTWPASGSPNIPIDQKIGLYSRVDKKFLGLDDQNRFVAGDESYDGVGSDEFIVVDAGDNGYIALLADNGKYLTVNRESQGQPLEASAEKIGKWQKFKWLELPLVEDANGSMVGDIALRPWAGSGDLIGTIASTDGDGFGLTGPVGSGVKYGGANSYHVLTSYADSVEPLPEPDPIQPGPFFGSPMPIPTNGNHDLPIPASAPDNRLYASDYDIGGEGISYHDTGAVNLGEAYRPYEGVDVESTNEKHTAVGFFEAEEWLQFTVDVAQAGNYTVTFRTASSGGGFISLESDCQKLTDNLATPDTGWWDIWQDMTVDVTLKAGVQKLRVVSGGNMNLMNMDIQPGGEGGADYGVGCEWQPPEPDDLKVEAEDWTNAVVAPEGTVNIGAVATDSDLSLHVANFDAGDFIEYAVELPETSCYRAEYRVASGTGSDGFELIFDNETVDIFKIPPTGDFPSWVSFVRHYELTEGSQTLRLEALGDSFNINWLTFNATEAIDCEQSNAIIIEAETFSGSIELPDGEVGTEATNDQGGGLNVGWIDAGDWMEYEINVFEAGNYSVSYRLANYSGSSKRVNLLVDGDLVDSALVPNTGGFQKWQTVDSGNIPLEAGDYLLRFEAPEGGLNLNWIKLTPTAGNIGTGFDNNLDVGEVINFNDPLFNYDYIIDLGDSTSSLEADLTNNFNTVVSITEGGNAQSGVKIASGQVTYPLSSIASRISMRVYSPDIGTSVRVRLQDSTNMTHSVETEAVTTVANKWETLVFDFYNSVEGTAELDLSYNFDTLSVFFNYSISGRGKTYYFDDITMLEVQNINVNPRIQAEDWTRVITSVKNTPTGVATQETEDFGGGENVGWIDRHDWMEYDFNVNNTGSYQLALRVAKNGSSSVFKVLLNGEMVDQIAVPNTGDWQNWQTVSGEAIHIDQGSNTLRIEAVDAGANINWMEFIDLSVVTVPELQANTQHVYVSEKTFSEDGGQVTVKLSYLADNPNTTGIGFRVNFDSNILSLNNVSDVFSGAIASGEVNAEGNALDFGWASLFGQFPGSSEAELATITFDITERSSGSAVIDISETSTAAGYLFDGQSHLVVISP